MPHARKSALAIGLVVFSSDLGRAQMTMPRDSLAVAPLRYVATRAPSPIHVDGRLDEPAWRTGLSIAGFRQVEPAPGTPSAFPTIVRVMFDSTNLYVGVECHDSLGARGIRVQDLRRKFNYSQNDLFGISIDALHDGRNVAAFQITPYGAQRELQVFDDALVNGEWEAVWRARTAIDEGGWTAEIAIPWSTLRYRRDGVPWNVNFYRIARRTNETSAWAPWPRSATAYRVQFAGQLAGLEPPPPRTAFRVRPYVLAGGERFGAAPPSATAGPLASSMTSRVRAGGEATWAPTSTSVLDLTINTDFAQAEVDRQVINTTQFSVLFPERRQFFLESGSLFDVGPTFLTVKPFFTRRVGLDAIGQPIRIDGGGRFVRRNARGGDGVLVIRQAATSDAGAATFGVARASRNIGAASRLGALVVARADEPLNGETRVDGARSLVTAVDAFSRIGRSLTMNAMVSAQSASRGRGTGVAAWANTFWSSPSLYTGVDVAVVNDDYDPPAGFVQRRGVIVTRPTIQSDWRPSWMPKVLRRFYPYIATSIYHDASSGRPGDLFAEAYIDFWFQNGALIYPDVGHSVQRVTTTFRPVRGVTIAPGTYTAWRGVFYAASDQSARYAAQTILSTGGYFDRVRDQVSVTARAVPSPRTAVSVNYDANRFRGAPSGEGTVITRLISPEARFALNPRLQLATFYQYNTNAARGALNARLSWEFAPLSYVYVVTNDARGVGPDAATVGPLRGTQQVVIKVVWLRQL